MRISALLKLPLELTIGPKAERIFFSPPMKHVRDETYLCQVWHENIFCQSILYKMKLFISMLYRSIWIRSLHSTCRAILQSFHMYVKTKIIRSFIEWRCIRGGDCTVWSGVVACQSERYSAHESFQKLFQVFFECAWNVKVIKIRIYFLQYVIAYIQQFIFNKRIFLQCNTTQLYLKVERNDLLQTDGPQKNK